MEKVTPVDEEYMFENLVIVSQTDEKGVYQGFRMQIL